MATQTEERTVKVEMTTPLSPVKTAVSEVEECECVHDEMVSVERLQDFLRNSKSPCEKQPSLLKNQMKVKRIKKQFVKWTAFFTIKAMTLNS